MDNREIGNIPKDNVVDLKAKISASHSEKKNRSLEELTEDAQRSESESSSMKSLKNVTKNKLRAFSSQSSAKKNRQDKKDEIDEIDDKRDIKSNYFLRYFIYFLVFLLPIFVLPFSVEIYEFNKTILLFVLSSLAFLTWMAKMIVIDKRLRFVRTPLDIPIIIFIFIVLLSSALSVDKISSILGFYGRFSESLMVYLSLAMLYFLGVNSAVKTTETKQCITHTMSINLIKTFLISSSIVVIVSLFYSLGLKFIPWNETQFDSFNLVAGSSNVLGIYLVSVIIVAFYFLLENTNAFIKYLIFALIVMSLILLAIIDFVPAWIVLMICLSIPLILMSMAKKKCFEYDKNVVEVKHCFISTGLVVIISFIFVATSLTFINKDVESNFESSSISSSIKNRITSTDSNSGSRFTKEIILDKKTVISVAVEGIKKDPISGIVGTGPGTYLYNFSKFKPVEFNSSVLWNIRFDKAGSEMIEKISTIGILGVFSYLLIIFLTIWMFLKIISRNIGTKQCLAPRIYLFSAWLSLLLFQFIYLESITIKFVFWILTIILAIEYIIASSNTPQPLSRGEYRHPNPSGEGDIEADGKNIFWEFKIRKSNYILYLSLLLAVAVPILVSYYYQIRFYQAEASYKTAIFAYDKATKDKNLTKENASIFLDESVKDLEEVAKKNPYNGSYKSFLSDVYFNRLTIAIQEESEKSDEEKNNQIIAQEMKGVVDHAKAAADAYPNNIFFQQRLGNIYAFMSSNIRIAYADEWAIKKYNKAISLEPSNPILYTELGKIFVLQYAESKEEDRINSAIGEFEKALELKKNYLDAGLQLGLAYEIKGDKEKAISQLSSFMENGTADMNIAFQLGRIYYNSGNITEAKNIFLEIKRLQPRNSNARYSLGLIYEKEKNSEEALKEFETVLLLNPDNQEVVERIEELKKIIEKANRKPDPIPEPEPIVEEGSAEDGAVEEDGI